MIPRWIKGPVVGMEPGWYILDGEVYPRPGSCQPFFCLIRYSAEGCPVDFNSPGVVLVSTGLYGPIPHPDDTAELGTSRAQMLEEL